MEWPIVLVVIVAYVLAIFIQNSFIFQSFSLDNIGHQSKTTSQIHPSKVCKNLHWMPQNVQKSDNLVTKSNLA